jgi:hypothetical protein
MVTLARRAHRIPFAPVVAVLFGVVAAILMAAVPVWLFEKGVVASGLPDLIAAAAPPLGLIARLLAIAAAFVGTALLVRLLLVPVGRMIDGKARARTPWRDAGYDADAEQARANPLPPRRPIFAPDELGAPLMSDEAIATVQPVVEPEVVAPMVEAALELAEPIIAEALEPTVVASADTDNSITALIRRLENGLARRASNDGDPDGSGNGAMPLSRGWIVAEKAEATPMPREDGDESIRQALGTLRQMASR